MNGKASCALTRTARAVAAVALVLTTSACAGGRVARPSDIAMPDGFKIEAAAKGLSAPTMVAFDDRGRMLIAESGYHGGGESRVTRIEHSGQRTVLVGGDAFGEEVPVTAVAQFEGAVYVAHAGSVSRVDRGRLTPVITGLPGLGDHQVNQMVFKDGFLYVAVGTVTNSAVVGPDNAVFGWLGVETRRQVHDVPCRDIVSTGAVFESENPLGSDPERQRTSAYAPYGTVLAPGTVVKGDPKCNGAVLRARPDGSELSVFAWGLRNPYGLEVGSDGAIYATMHGFDARGSRPIEDAWDCVYRVDEGAWYGWPDFACDLAVTDERFHVKNKPPPGFLIANHPTETPPAPIARFNPHAATNGFAFSPSPTWGPPTTAYIALFGDFTPATGTVDRPRGVKIVKLDTVTGEVSDFIDNETPGQASRHAAGGLEHPSDVTFGPDGAMYITDWSIARVSEVGLVLEPNSGVVWKVVPGEAPGGFPGGASLLYAILGTLALAGATVGMGFGRDRVRRPVDGALGGAVAGLVMGLFTMAVAAPALDLPWHAPPRVLATMVMGRSALANILEFDLVPVLVGAAVLVALTVSLGVVFALLVRARQRPRVAAAGLLFGLSGWALLQFFVLPLLFPLVTEKGFPPQWYALSFGLYGLVLGALVAWRPSAGEEGDGRGGRAPQDRRAVGAGFGPERQLTQEERLDEWRRRRAGGH